MAVLLYLERITTSEIQSMAFSAKEGVLLLVWCCLAFSGVKGILLLFFSRLYCFNLALIYQRSSVMGLQIADATEKVSIKDS